jgi:4-hydroxybenzoate polyprenyltransferase
MTFIPKLITSGKLAATKPAILMLMTASLSCGVLAIFLSFLAGISILIALPGLLIAAFFAYRYAMYNRTKGRREEEQHKRSRKRRNR